MRTGVSEVKDPFLPVTHQWLRLRTSGLLVTCKRIYFSYRITELASFCLFVLCFSLCQQCYQGGIISLRKKHPQQFSAVVVELGKMTEKGGLIFQLSLGLKSEFPQLPVCATVSPCLSGYIGEAQAWSLHQEKQS